MARGGRWGDFGTGSEGWTPGATFDIADSDDTNESRSFSNAYYYAFYWLSILTDGSQLYVGGNTSGSWWVERETHSEIEAEAMAVDCYQLHSWPPWDYGIPIGCIILRNNGNTVDKNQFMPIDPVNRGRSYIWRTHDSLAPRNVM